MWRIILFFYISAFFFFNLAMAKDISDWDNTATGDEDGQTIIFVGEKIALEEYDEACPEGFLCMDSRFNARYKIIDLLIGEYDGTTIDFAVYDHYGTPKFSYQDKVILYLLQENGKLFHRKYMFDPLHRLENGDYAFCGDPYWQYEESLIEEFGREDLIPLQFFPKIKVDLSDYLLDPKHYHEEEPEYIRENYVDTMRQFAPPAFIIKNNKATCKMGVMPETLADIRMEFVIIPDQEYDQKYDFCWKKSGLPDSGVSFEQRRESGFEACLKN